MSSSEKKQVLLLIETSRSFGRQVIQGISQFTAEHRSWSIIFQDRSIYDRLPEWLRHWDGDGVILRTVDPNVYRQLKRLDIPIIELFGDGKRNLPIVRCDESLTCRMVADHFRERGFRNFAFFSLGNNWWSTERLQAFQKALKDNGECCDVSPTVRMKNDISLSIQWWKGCDDEAFEWLRGLKKPVGVFCPWDMHAFYLMNLCQSRGLAVPDEIAVVGYGNNADLCRISTPSLSSVVPNAREIGYRAATLLEKIFQGGSIPKEPVFIPATHIETRQSSDIVAVRDELVSSAVRHIRENADRDLLDVSRVARMFNVSNSTLTRRFRKELGHTPDVEIIRVRVKLAMEFLRETRFSIVEISFRLGYANSANFIRAFRKITGMTPEEYRHRIRQE